MKAALLRIPGADYRESSQSSAFQADTLFGGWPASLGDMVRFLAQAGLSCNARPWEQTLFLPSAWHPSPGPPWLWLGDRVVSACPPPTPLAPLVAHQQADPGTLVRETRCAYRETLTPDIAILPILPSIPRLPWPPRPWFRLGILHNFVPPTLWRLCEKVVAAAVCFP